MRKSFLEPTERWKTWFGAVNYNYSINFGSGYSLLPPMAAFASIPQPFNKKNSIEQCSTCITVCNQFSATKVMIRLWRIERTSV